MLTRFFGRDRGLPGHESAFPGLEPAQLHGRGRVQSAEAGRQIIFRGPLPRLPAGRPFQPVVSFPADRGSGIPRRTGWGPTAPGKTVGSFFQGMKLGQGQVVVSDLLAKLGHLQIAQESTAPLRGLIPVCCSRVMASRRSPLSLSSWASNTAAAMRAMKASPVASAGGIASGAGRGTGHFGFQPGQGQFVAMGMPLANRNRASPGNRFRKAGRFNDHGLPGRVVFLPRALSGLGRHTAADRARRCFSENLDSAPSKSAGQSRRASSSSKAAAISSGGAGTWVSPRSWGGAVLTVNHKAVRMRR